MNNRKYKVIMSKSAQKEFSKLDSFIAKKIKRWIDNNLVDCETLTLMANNYVEICQNIGDTESGIIGF